MPRRIRLDLPGVPVHITHRGVNRAKVFLEPDDFSEYRIALAKALSAHQVQLHAYVFMSNHVHLLASAGRRGSISRAMQAIGLRYVPGFNRRHVRTGTLWEGRFKSCLVDSQCYLLNVYRYIELNPVRAGIVTRAEDYHWSSARANLGGAHDALLTPHPEFRAFSTGAEAEGAPYRTWLEAGTAPDELRSIRTHTNQERALGSQAFQENMQAKLRLPVACRPRGRPASRPVEDNSNKISSDPFF